MLSEWLVIHMEKKKKNQLKLDLFHSIHAHSEQNHRKDKPGEKVTGMPSPTVPSQPLSPGWRTPVPSQDPVPSAPLGAPFFVSLLLCLCLGAFQTAPH